MREQKELTTSNKALLNQFAEAVKQDNRLTSDWAVEQAIFSEYVKLATNSFNILPEGYYRSPNHPMNMAKARKNALGINVVTMFERMKEELPSTNWGYYTDGVDEYLRDNFDLNVGSYRLKSIVNAALAPSVPFSSATEHNRMFSASIKRADYLKKVKKDDPLCADLRAGETCYEYTDAMFDNHIEEFKDVLFIGHQLRVVKDDNGYQIQKLNGSWEYIAFVENLREAIIELPDRLQRIEQHAVKDAVERAKRGKSIASDLFTEREVRQLAEAQGVELPQEKTFSVCNTGASYEPFIVIEDSEVTDKTAVGVVLNSLSFDDASRLKDSLNTRERVASRIERAQERVENLQQQLREATMLFQELTIEAKQKEVLAATIKDELKQATALQSEAAQ